MPQGHQDSIAESKAIEVEVEVDANTYGITTRHSKMPNGELRFRLQHKDGSAYIRTVAGEDGGWQKSHYHLSVRETYIVQQGWLGYAEPGATGVTASLTRYEPGDIFTTPPGVVHNIYLPADAVIHTVKHGEIDGDERMEDDRSRAFTDLTHNIPAAAFTSRAGQPLAMQPAASASAHLPLSSHGDYSEGYRHFDNLIWQVPAWSSAIFAVVLAGAGDVAPNNVLAQATALSVEQLLSGFYAATGSFLLILSYALYRFRWHQTAFKNYTPHWVSPQLGLQTIVNAEAAIFCGLALSLGGMPLGLSIPLSLLLLVECTLYQQWQVNIQARSKSSNASAGSNAKPTRS